MYATRILSVSNTSDTLTTGSLDCVDHIACRTDQRRNSHIPLRTTTPDAQQGQDPHYQCEKRASQILRNPDLNWKRQGTKGGDHDEWLKKASEAAIDGLGNRPGSPSG